MEAARVRSVSKSFSDRAVVDHVSLDVNEGEILVLLGPSGCGKTTLLRLLAGLEIPDSGEVMAGHPLGPVHARGRLIPRDISLVFQDLALWPHFTVRKHLDFVLQEKVAPQERNRRILELLQEVGLNDKTERYPHELSGGEKQRLALARSLVSEPALLLLDEPLSSLDPPTAAGLRRFLKRIQRKRRFAMVYVTHSQDEAFELADRLAVMRHGRILQCGRPEEVIRRPLSRATAEFIGGSVLVPGTRQGAQFHSVFGPLLIQQDCPAEGQVVMVLRESDVEMDSSSSVKAELIESYVTPRGYDLTLRIDELEFRMVSRERPVSSDRVGVLIRGPVWLVPWKDSP